LNGKVDLQNEYVCCLDYSIGKKDRLATYQYNGEPALNSDNLVTVSYDSKGLN